MKGYWFRPEDGDKDIPIRQYIRLDYLIHLLETRKYYAKRRYKFNDRNESYYNINLEFKYNPVGNNVLPSLNKEKRMMTLKEIIDCPTACWTKNENESYLMWKSYASEMGACIISSVYSVINSLGVEFTQDGENRLLLGSMEYTSCCQSAIEEHQFFLKNISFADENEFRFYFDFKSGIMKGEDYILIPIDIHTLIKKVQLSPFINREAADKLARMLFCSYNINVSPSNIEILT